jgi:hypothetical protein
LSPKLDRVPLGIASRAEGKAHGGKISMTFWRAKNE